METVIVELPGGAGPVRKPHLVRLGPGETARFGRGAPDRPVDIAIRDTGVSKVAGEIHAVDDYWLISHLSRTATYVVENPEGGGEHIKIPPRRCRSNSPASCCPRATGSRASRCTRRSTGSRRPSTRAGGEPTVRTFPLDETSKYFLVLVALCEPRLRDASPVAIPTVTEVVDRLREVDGGLSRSAVNYHIDYLATVKLRIKEWAGAQDADRLDWKREALVSLALRFDLVREEHLALLPPRRSVRRRSRIEPAG